MGKNDISSLLKGGTPKYLDGWIYLNIVGDPYERGFQHGYYLAEQIKDAIRVNKFLAEWDTGMKWKYFEDNAVKLFLKHIDDEIKEEIRGIADGACYSGFNTTFEEILTWNSYQDLLGSWWPNKKDTGATSLKKPHRCSAFISSTGDNIVMAQNCWDRYAASDHYNIILDIEPTLGNRMIFQCPPGYIASTIDWWVTSAKLVITETTISHFNGFDETKAPEFYRSRKACQYADSINTWKDIMSKNNNGGYPGSWLIGDIKTGEIARIEIGLKFIGCEIKKNGYFSSYNVASDLKIRNQECSNNAYSDIRDSGARRVRFMQLLDQYKNIDIEAAKKIISDHYDVYLEKEDNPCSRSICGHLELDDAAYGSHSSAEPYYPWGASDGKVIDSNMVENMSFSAIFGHSCGMPFDKDEFLKKHPQYNWLDEYMKSRPSHSWQIIKGK